MHAQIMLSSIALIMHASACSLVVSAYQLKERDGARVVLVQCFESSANGALLAHDIVLEVPEVNRPILVLIILQAKCSIAPQL